MHPLYVPLLLYAAPFSYTNWAIGAAVASLVECILKDERRVVPVSTDVDGMHGIDKNVFLSMPCVLGREGVIRVSGGNGAGLC